MGLPRMFKLPKARQFNYKPRFYDEEKEHREERREQIKAEVRAEKKTEEKEKDYSNYSPNIKGQMRSQYQREVRSTQKWSSLRLIIILAALFALTFYLIYS